MRACCAGTAIRLAQHAERPGNNLRPDPAGRQIDGAWPLSRHEPRRTRTVRPLSTCRPGDVAAAFPPTVPTD